MRIFLTFSARTATRSVRFELPVDNRSQVRGDLVSFTFSAWWHLAKRDERYLGRNSCNSSPTYVLSNTTAMSTTADPDSMEMNVTLNCTSDGSSLRKRLVLSPSPRTVQDVKNHIQKIFSIPRCSQKLTMNGSLLPDAQDIHQLHLRCDDVFTVTYLAKGDVEDLSLFINQHLGPLVVILQAKPELVGQHTYYLEVEHEHLMRNCENGFFAAIYTHLVQWESPRAEVNRQYIIQENGIDHTVHLLSLLQTVPWERRHQLLKDLEVSCVSLLWNIGETAYVRHMVVERGGFVMLVKSLLTYTDENFIDNYSIHDIFDQALGGVSNYCELECCRLQVFENKRVMYRLFEFAVRGSNINIFNKMLIANCLFRISFSFETHTYFTQGEVLQKLFDFHNRHQTMYRPNIAVRYILAVLMARLLLYSFKTIPSTYTPRMVDAMEVFVRTTQVGEIVTFEDRYQYNWISILPFVEMMFVPLSDGMGSLQGQHECEYISMRLIILSLQAEFGRKVNRDLAVKQGLLEYIVCMPWGIRSEWSDGCKQILKGFMEDRKSGLPVPRLSTIAKVKLARHNRRLRDLLQ